MLGILLTRLKHSHDRIISLRGEDWAHKTSVTPPLFIVVSVPGQKMSGYVFISLSVEVLIHKISLTPQHFLCQAGKASGHVFV